MRAADWIVVGILLVMAAGWIGGLADVRRRDPEAFAATGRSRTAWSIAILLTGIVAAFVYVCFVRRSVRRAEAAMISPVPGAPDGAAVDAGVDGERSWQQFAPRRD